MEDTGPNKPSYQRPPQLDRQEEQQEEEHRDEKMHQVGNGNAPVIYVIS